MAATWLRPAAATHPMSAWFNEKAAFVNDVWM